jgi:quinohemoprotein ethanol dehydrogenase
MAEPRLRSARSRRAAPRSNTKTPTASGPTPPARIEEPFAKPPPQTSAKAEIDAGEVKFAEECSRCHVLGPSSTPDLRKLNAGLHAAFKDIVLKGVLAPSGMERFDDILSEKDVDNIHAYLIDQSWVAYREQERATHPEAKAAGQ